MNSTLIRNKCRGVLLSSATQIEIVELRSKGKSYEEIDSILGVPKGSSLYTMNHVRGRK